jgi:hypothetical protein
MASSVIRSFLVNLGFQTDENALKNFTGGISKATKAVGGLAFAVEAMVTTVVIGVQKFASNLEALYFASKRTGSSATELMAFDRTMQNFGASAGEALGSVENLARLVRQNPGYENLLTSLGVQVRHLKDGSIDAGAAMVQLAGRFRAMPMYMAEQWASQLGISEKVMLGMRDGSFESEMKRVQKNVANQGLEKATEDAHRFMVALRDLSIYLQAFGIRVYDILSQRLGLSFEKIERWLEANGPRLADNIGKALTALITLAERMTPIIAWLIDKFMEWDKSTHGLSTQLLAAYILLTKFGGGQILSGVFGLVRAFTALGTGLGSVVTLAGTLSAILGASAILDLVKAFTGAGPGGAGTWIKDHLVGDEASNSLGGFMQRIAAFGGSRDAKDNMARMDPMQYLLDQGRGRLSREQVAGILANVQRESGFNSMAKNPGSTAWGLAQWTKSSGRQDDFKSWAGKDIHGSSLSEQYDFMLYELLQGKQQRVGKMLQAQSNAANAARILSRDYEGHGVGAAEDEKRAEIAQSIINNNTYHIHGARDPVETAKQIEAVHNRQLQTATRNAASAG